MEVLRALPAPATTPKEDERRADFLAQRKLTQEIAARLQAIHPRRLEELLYMWRVSNGDLFYGGQTGVAKEIGCSRATIQDDFDHEEMDEWIIGKWRAKTTSEFIFTPGTAAALALIAKRRRIERKRASKTTDQAVENQHAPVQKRHKAKPNNTSSSRFFIHTQEHTTNVAVESMKINEKETTGSVTARSLTRAADTQAPLAQAESEITGLERNPSCQEATTAKEVENEESLANKGKDAECVTRHDGAKDSDLMGAISGLESNWHRELECSSGKRVEAVPESPEATMIGMLVSEGVARPQAVKLTREFSLDRIGRNLTLTGREDAANPAGWIVKAIREDWAKATPQKRAYPLPRPMESFPPSKPRISPEPDVYDAENVKALHSLIAAKMPMISGSFAHEKQPARSAISPLRDTITATAKPVERGTELREKTIPIAPPEHPVVAKYNAMTATEKAMLRENILTAMERVEAKTAAALRSDSPPEYAVRKLAGAIADRLKAKSERIAYDLRMEPLATIARDMAALNSA